MGIDSVVNAYFILLFAGAIISFLIGLVLMKKLKSLGKALFCIVYFKSNYSNCFGLMVSIGFSEISNRDYSLAN